LPYSSFIHLIASPFFLSDRLLKLSRVERTPRSWQMARTELPPSGQSTLCLYSNGREETRDSQRLDVDGVAGVLPGDSGEDPKVATSCEASLRGGGTMRGETYKNKIRVLAVPIKSLPLAVAVDLYEVIDLVCGEQHVGHRDRIHTEAPVPLVGSL